jgi:hypothetical protein
MSAPRLSRAVAASAAVHLGVLAALLGAAHPGVSPSTAIRVSLVGRQRRPPRQGAGSPATGAAPASAAAIAARPPPTPRCHVPRAGRSPSRLARRRSSRRCNRTSGCSPRRRARRRRAPRPRGDTWRRSHARARGRGSGPAAGQAGADTGGANGASLLAALSQRLAWSAARCAPAALVRTTRHTVPGVPLHFCLDATGRPSDVGLLGTTGSEQLDRAARDCVVPGALPLPPAPGCYTVEVRFPNRG